MDEAFIRNRIFYLRTKKGVSEYKMSLELGRSKSYMQSISSGRTLPSLSEFLSICRYFGVTPKEFFDESQPEPALLHELYEEGKNLSDADLKGLILLARRLNPNA